MTYTKIAIENHRLRGENKILQTGYDAARLEIESLKARVDEVGRIARENRSCTVVELEQEIKALQAALTEEYASRSQKDFAIECYEKDLDTIKAALPADKYDSKDWREGCTRERIQWLHDMYASAKEEIERLTTDVLNLQADSTKMLDALTIAGQAFHRYAAHHKAKGDTDKAARNSALADVMCAAIISLPASHAIEPDPVGWMHDHGHVISATDKIESPLTFCAYSTPLYHL